MEIAKITMVDYKLGPSLYEAVKRVNELLGGKLHFQFYDTREVDNGLVDYERFRGDLRDSHVVLLNIMGGDTVSKIVCEELSNTDNTVVVLVGGSSEIVSLTRLGSFSFKMLSRLGMGKRKADYGAILKMRERFERIGRNLPFSFLKHARNYVLLLKYYENPTVENYYAMLLLLIKEYCKLKIDAEIPEPIVLPSMGVMNFKSGDVYTDINDYLTMYEHKDRPLVGILFYGGHHHEESYPAAKLLTEKLESSGFGVIPVFSSDLRYYLAIDRFFFIGGKPIVELIIDLLWFRFAGGPIGGDHNLTLSALTRLNVPILHSVQLHSRTTDEWLCSRQGLSPIEIVTSVTLPELDGRIEPTVTHGPTRKTLEDVKIEEYQVIEERVEKLVRRAKSWVNLRNKRNSEKRIAIIIYNYPPGEENLGKVEGLEIFKSLSKLLQAMKERGYTIPEDLPP